MRYIPHTPEDIARMLRVIGVSSVEELFHVIPADQRFTGDLPLPAALSEGELLRHLQGLGASNKPAGPGNLVFAGAGLHPHAVPVAVDHLSMRSEFYTAYTPYQPEVSQGTLLAIFEYQTMVCELFGMEFSNASMYDGATATTEAVLMARRLKQRRPRTLLCGGLHPEHADTCRTYLAGLGSIEDQLTTVPLSAEGGTDVAALEAALGDDVAAVVVQSPNFFGQLQDLGPICEAAHAAGALVIAVCTEPLALALMTSPGEAGADIAVGEGIGLAGPPNLGGPGLGMLCSRGKKAMRAMPGRLVGQTTDSEGRPGFVLTLSTREQHIRREKATSNICTNHGLMALRLAIHLSLLGKGGFTRLARLNLAKARFAREQLSALAAYSLRHDGPAFSEICLRVPGGNATAVVRAAAAKGVVPGVALGRFSPELDDTLLVSVNESHTRQDIETLARTLAKIGQE